MSADIVGVLFVVVVFGIAFAWRAVDRALTRRRFKDYDFSKGWPPIPIPLPPPPAPPPPPTVARSVREVAG